LCTYVTPAGSVAPVCPGNDDSCMLVENAKCFTTIYGTSLQVNLVGNSATILYFPGSTSCTSTGATTSISNNIVLDTCFADPDLTAEAGSLAWKISRIRF